MVSLTQVYSVIDSEREVAGWEQQVVSRRRPTASAVKPRRPMLMESR